MVHVRLSYLTNNRVAFWTAAYKSEAGALALTKTVVTCAIYCMQLLHAIYCMQ